MPKKLLVKSLSSQAMLKSLSSQAMLIGSRLLVISLFIILNSLFVIPVFATPNFDQVNQKVCDRFEGDTERMAAIMDEYRDRHGIKQTRVAYGQVNTPVESADYWVNYAAEAIAYQRAQHYSSPGSLRSSLQILAGKVLKAKNAIRQINDL